MSKINKLATELLLEISAFAQLSPSHEVNHAINLASNLVAATDALPVNADAVIASKPTAAETPEADKVSVTPIVDTQVLESFKDAAIVKAPDAEDTPQTEFTTAG